MKNILYIALALIVLASCKKSSVSGPYSFKTAMDSLHLQFGKQYTYKHYTDSTLFETGYIIFNADTSFTEIMNTDTFYYHANIIYTYDPHSTKIYLPGVESIQGNVAGLQYTCYSKIASSTLLYPGDAYLAWCCYRNDSVKGNPDHFLPLAYYLQKFAPVFLGIDAGHIRITPPASTDSLGFPVYGGDKIIIQNF